jgi:hypothetical protein
MALLRRNKLPVVCLPKNKWEVEGSLLFHGSPVSNGTLRPMQQTSRKKYFFCRDYDTYIFSTFAAELKI